MSEMKKRYLVVGVESNEELFKVAIHDTKTNLIIILHDFQNDSDNLECTYEVLVDKDISVPESAIDESVNTLFDNLSEILNDEEADS